MLVEMHAHVIYGADDGPETPEEMQRMLQSAAQTGVRHLFCTSHGGAGFPKALYEEHFQEAQAIVREKGLTLTLHKGSEVYWTADTPLLLASGALLPLGDTRAVLLEFDPMTTADQVFTAVSRLRQENWHVVLAHAERCPALCRGRVLQRLRQEQGVKVQLNAASVFEDGTGFFFRRRIQGLLRGGLADYVSSDAHDTFQRPFCLPYAHHWLSRHFSEETADALCGGNAEKDLCLR